ERIRRGIGSSCPSWCLVRHMPPAPSASLQDKQRSPYLSWCCFAFSRRTNQRSESFGSKIFSSAAQLVCLWARCGRLARWRGRRREPFQADTKQGVRRERV